MSSIQDIYRVFNTIIVFNNSCTMKVYIQSLIVFLSFFFSLSAFAAGPHDAFEVILWEETAKVGEAIDLTISAVDANGEIVTDYTWDILVFSESDLEADFPNDLAGNSYSFTSVNEGTVKFENAVRFQNPWLQDVYVYALIDDSILWVAEIQISEEEVEDNIEIEILSPENGITLATDTITVSGTTNKNHQIRVLVNDNQDLFTTSNDDGIFEKEVDGLLEWSNTIKAVVLNADEEVIGESELIQIKISSSAPMFKSISVTPSGDVESESEITIEVVSNTWLSQVRAIINDIITELNEGSDGVYVGTTNAPKEVGLYDVDVVLRDEFALETIERWVDTLSVVEIPELNSGEEPTVIEEIPTEELAAAPESLDLRIKDIEVTELKTKSVITWWEVSDAEWYNIYKKVSDTQIELIESTTEPRYEIEITGDEIRYDHFAIKAIGKTSTWVLVQWDLSEMTKVKTGPELYIIFALLALLMTAWIFFMRREA